MSTILPLALENVSVRRRSARLIGPVSAQIDGRGITIIVGPNGSGKTTLLKVMHGVERVSEGRVRWAAPNSEAQHHQSYVFQTPIMLRRSVADNLRYPLQLHGVARIETDRRMLDWAQKIGLQDHLHLSAPRLSGGEQQRLALGRALIRRPEVLFLDEPCANLDGAATHHIETLLMEARDAGTKIIMTTHNMGQAKRLADEGIFMLRGVIWEESPADTFFEKPQSAELQAFFRGDIIA